MKITNERRIKSLQTYKSSIIDQIEDVSVQIDVRIIGELEDLLTEMSASNISPNGLLDQLNNKRLGIVSVKQPTLL